MMTGRNYTPGAVSQIGESLGNHATDSGARLDPHAPMYQGRGGAAPKTSVTTHHCGSQGKHE